MLGLPLAFAVPAVLGALALLPALYVLLRLTPPRPRAVPLPPFRLIFDLQPKDETPARTPPWLLLLRIAVAGFLILAMSGPIWNPPAALGAGTGPVVIVLDDGFAAAVDWDARTALARQRLLAAQSAGRLTAVAVVSEGDRPIEPATASQTIERLRALKPVPVEPDRLLALPALSAFAKAHPHADFIWIADGLERGGARAFGQGLATIADDRAVSIVTAPTTPVALAGTDNKANTLDVRVIRADARAVAQGAVRALDAKGLVLGEAPFNFGTGRETTGREAMSSETMSSETMSNETWASFDLPVELRNEIARVVIAGEPSAGAVGLLDARGRRRRVAIVTGGTADVAQPLLSPSYYIAKALAPFADLQQARGGVIDPIVSLLDDQPSVMILADVGALTGPAHDRLVRFVDNGGLLLRFAGSRLAAASDDLVPVALRRGGRTFGGALSWEKPKPLAPFERGSPFVGLPMRDEVTVSRQVLAEPDAGLPAKTWAQLVDGTPLVTAEKRGKGTIVLFHVTADTTWSSLPLSGLFVDMLRRVVDLSGASAPARDTATGSATTQTVALLGPTRILDGFGVLGSPPATSKPIPATFEGPASADHPPGFYGPLDAALAVNALGPADTLAVADLSGRPLDPQQLRAEEPVDLRAPLVTLALVGFLADALASIWLGGGLRRRAWRSKAATATTLALLALGLLTAGPGGRAFTGAALADEPPVSHRDMDAALATRIGYIVTGDAAVDDESRLGLVSLSRALADRTSLSPGDPVGLDPAKDELAFYPMLYWPVVASRPQPGTGAVDRIAAYMKNGGTIVFDTRDALTSRQGSPPTPEQLWLKNLLAGVDVPELEPVPSDHVVTKTFYLLSGFMGRYTSGLTWIEALPPVARDEANRPVRAGDSVSPIVITSNDLAAGWASDADGEPIYPLVPGGSRQRELSLRGGINLVMYTLTGNYKADQVHVRDLLERLAH